MVRYHALLSLRELGRRAEFLNAQLEHLNELIVPLVTARAPGLRGWYGITVALAVTHRTSASPWPGTRLAMWATHIRPGCPAGLASASLNAGRHFRPVATVQ
jgi:hypothetical protein